jgi:hypothetical protein
MQEIFDYLEVQWFDTKAHSGAYSVIHRDYYTRKIVATIGQFTKKFDAVRPYYLCQKKAVLVLTEPKPDIEQREFKQIFEASKATILTAMQAL